MRSYNPCRLSESEEKYRNLAGIYGDEAVKQRVGIATMTPDEFLMLGLRLENAYLRWQLELNGG